MAKAKRKKNSETIVIATKIEIPREDPNKAPECYGEKGQYCRENICGEWFESCKKSDT